MNGQEVLNSPAGDVIVTAVTHPMASIAGVVAAIAAIVWPVIQIIRKFDSDKSAAIRRNDAEITLYEHLKEQIETNKKNLDDALRENRQLWETIRDLGLRLKAVESIEANYERLRKKLDEKDDIIAQKNSEIKSLQKDLAEKDKQIRKLELRVTHLESCMRAS